MCSIEHKVDGNYSTQIPRDRSNSKYSSFSSSYSGRENYSSENY